MIDKTKHQGFWHLTERKSQNNQGAWFYAQEQL